MFAQCKRGLVLIGFMGAGKTTVAAELGRECNLPVVDLDLEIARVCGRSIPEIFAEAGEAVFRDHETSVLRGLLFGGPIILATGGGVVGREENWSLMRQLGRVVYLRASLETLRERIGAGEGRPLAGDRERFERLLTDRLPLYERADLAIDTDGRRPVAIARDILRAIYWENV